MTSQVIGINWDYKYIARNPSAKMTIKVVASMDWPQVTYYKGLVFARPHRQEMIQDLSTPSGKPVSGGLIRELLISFYKITNRKPERLYFTGVCIYSGRLSSTNYICGSAEEASYMSIF